MEAPITEPRISHEYFWVLNLQNGRWLRTMHVRAQLLWSESQHTPSKTLWAKTWEPTDDLRCRDQWQLEDPQDYPEDLGGLGGQQELPWTLTTGDHQGRYQKLRFDPLSEALRWSSWCLFRVWLLPDPSGHVRWWRWWRFDSRLWQSICSPGAQGQQEIQGTYAESAGGRTSESHAKYRSLLQGTPSKMAVRPSSLPSSWRRDRFLQGRLFPVGSPVLVDLLHSRLLLLLLLPRAWE